MIALIIIVALAFALSLLLKKSITETLPVAVFTAALSVYVFALLLPLNAAMYICLVATVVFTTAITVYVWRKIGIRPGYVFSEKHSFIILIVVGIVFCVLVSGHRVFFYDDLSYWGLYTKNIFLINKLPHLYENCSVNYKDYTPIMQILQYMAMFGQSVFDESMMFRTNVCFIYLMLLPLLSIVFDKTQPDKPRYVKIFGVVLYVIFPHILTAQFYYRLGVDLFLALVFGYVLYYVFLYKSDDKTSEIFRMGAIATGLAFLSLIKTSGIFLCLFAIVFFGIREYSGSKGQLKNNTIKTAVVMVATFGAYLGWQLFLHYSWNNGYLSNRVKDGVTGGTFSFPPYTKEVVLNYIKHFFIYPLTRNSIGVTAAALVIFIILVHFVSKGMGAVGLRMILSVLIGLVVFCIAHIYMYLFVFDDWEAFGLLEFDRYITQYLGGIFFLYACKLLKCAGEGKERILLVVSTVVFIALLPYADMKDYLIRDNYEAKFEESYGVMSRNAQAEWAGSGIASLGLKHDGSQKITVIADAWDDTTQFIEYAAVPQPINRIVNVPGADPGTINGFIMDYVDEYVYVCDNAPDSYEGDWSETKEITADGDPLVAGTLYKVDRSTDDKKLEVINPAK